MNLSYQTKDLHESLVLRPELGPFQDVIYHKMEFFEGLLGFFVETILELENEYQ
jgi:hypothetical protein